MSTGFSNRKSAVEIVHLRCLDASLIRRPLTILRNTPDCYFGTSSLHNFTSEYHTITTASIIPLPAVDGKNGWRTVTTHKITLGVWELRIRASHNIFAGVVLGYINDDRPYEELSLTPGDLKEGKGGNFELNSGSMRKGSYNFKANDTNKRCDRIGQTAAIRVDMGRKEVKLFVDDEEQPGFFSNASKEVSLCVSTHVKTKGIPVEVMWLKRVDTETRKPATNTTPTSSPNTLSQSAPQPAIAPSTSQSPARLAQSSSNVGLSTSQTPAQPSQSRPSVAVSTSQTPAQPAQSRPRVALSTSQTPARPAQSRPSVALSTSQTPARLAQSHSNVGLSTSQTQQPSPAQRTIAPSPQTPSMSQRTTSNSTPNAASTARTLPSNPLPPALSTGQTSSGEGTLFVGTSALQRFNRSSATLSPSILTIRSTDEERSRKDGARSFFTAPITEGEWELKIRGTEDLFTNLMLCYLSHPFVDDAFNMSCGDSIDGSGGEFVLTTGRMWREGKEFKPAGTNTACVRAGQTAAIRANMDKREVRLFVDDEEQPGIFTDIPIQVSLAISHYRIRPEFKIEVIHLKRLDPAITRQPPRKLENTPKFWPGTNSLMELDKNNIKLTPTQLIQTTSSQNRGFMTTSFSIKEGEWELKIRVNHSALEGTSLGFLSFSLSHPGAKGSDSTIGFFDLPSGGQCVYDTITSDCKNKPCFSLGQTAAIRVNMEKREATLFVDEEEQPHRLFPLPDVVHLFIGTDFDCAHSSLEVMWLKKLRSTPKHTLPPNTPTCLFGTSCLQTLPPPFRLFSSSILFSTVAGTGQQSSTETISLQGHSTAYTNAITNGEWELKIRRVGSTIGASALGFHHHPLPPNNSPSISQPTKTDVQYDFDLVNGILMKDSRPLPNSIQRNGVWGDTVRTAAIRVDMTLRTATLFLDDNQQPHIFTDLPSSVYLGITHPHKMKNIFTHFVEVMWLKRVDTETPKPATNTPPTSSPNTLSQSAPQPAVAPSTSQTPAQPAQSRPSDGLSTSQTQQQSPAQRTIAPSQSLSSSQSTASNSTPNATSTVRTLPSNPLPPAPSTGQTSTGEVTLFIGTSALQQFDRSCTTLSPSILTIRSTDEERRRKDNARSFFTPPITEGEWELKIRGTEDLFTNLMLCYLSSPFVDDAFNMSCGDYNDGSGGEFVLKTGEMWREGKEFKPEGTNRRCNRIGQTAAIRVNMDKREARLFVDDEEQPGIFTDIPIQVSLAISHFCNKPEFKVEVIHLKRLDPAIPRQPPRKLENTPNFWPGTNSLVEIDEDGIQLTPTQLIQTTSSPDKGFVANTFAIEEGEWELKIRVNHSALDGTWLGFMTLPRSDQRAKRSDSSSKTIIGVFDLPIGVPYLSYSASFKQTNKPCSCLGQTVAIRVNMEKREATLFVDGEEQPHRLFPLPDVVCLFVRTGFKCAHSSLEVMWLKKLKHTHKHTLPPNTPTCLFGTSCLHTLPPPFELFSSSLLSVMPRETETTGRRTAFTFPITEGEWELRIKPFGSHFDAFALGFLRCPLPLNATDKSLSNCENGISGAFILKSGQTIAAGRDIRPTARNDVWDKPNQTAAIRVNMDRREAVLFLDDVKQHWIFTDVPSPLCLGITVEASENVKLIEIVHFKQLTPPQKLKNTPNFWPGTNSLETIDSEAHELSPSQLIQIVRRDAEPRWRTAFTFPIEGGEWELKIRSIRETLKDTRLCFASAPLSLSACTSSFRTSNESNSGFFDLWNGSMHRPGQFIPLNLNGKCQKVGQTAAIRVNMLKREVRLFVDDVEQPGIFTDIPSPLCLGISTGYPNENRIALEVLGLKKLPPSPPPLFSNTPTCLFGTSCLTNLDPSKITFTPTTLTIMKKDIKDFTFQADTGYLCEGEWELKIRGGQDMFLNTRLAYFSHRDLGVVKSSREFKPQYERAFSLRQCLDLKTLTNPHTVDAVTNEPHKTAAIRVNMEKREAKLFVDDVEHSRTFENIPPILNLSILAVLTASPYILEVVHLKRLDTPSESRIPTLPNTPNCWPGTNSIETFDRAGLVISPTQIVLRMQLELDPICYSAYTFPIEEGEWELKIRMRQKKPRPVDLGFLRFPLPPNAPLKSCGSWLDGSGGAYSLSTGRMWRGEMIRPAGTNKKVSEDGQTAAIRVNMSTREARLLVDGEEQPGIFTDIPDKLCLAISMGFIAELFIVEVLHLKRLDAPTEKTSAPDSHADHSPSVILETQGSSAPPIEYSNEPTPSPATSDLSTVPSTQPQPSPATVLAQPALRSPPPTSPARPNTDDLNVGTSCLQTLDGASHHTTDFTLTARASTAKVIGFRTAFTMALSEGEWELKIRGTASLFANLLLGFLKHPLRPNATQKSCGSWSDGSGGGFVLKTGHLH